MLIRQVCLSQVCLTYFDMTTAERFGIERYKKIYHSDRTTPFFLTLSLQIERFIPQTAHGVCLVVMEMVQSSSRDLNNSNSFSVLSRANYFTDVMVPTAVAWDVIPICSFPLWGVLHVACRV